MLLRNSLFSFLRLRRMQPGSLSSHPQDKHPPPKCSFVSGYGVLHGTVLIPHCCREIWGDTPCPLTIPCLPPPPAALLQVRSSSQGMSSAFGIFACAARVPFFHPCMQIPICPIIQPFGRVLPVHSACAAGQNCLCLSPCQPRRAQVLRVCLEHLVHSLVCLYDLSDKPAVLRCEDSPLLVGDFGASERDHRSEC